MSIDTNISFSQFVAMNMNGSSGFLPEDYISESIDNMIDAGSTNINILFITIENKYYIITVDNGEGCDNLTKFFSIGDSVQRKENKIGCKNTGFLASLVVLQPTITYILSKSKLNTNKKTLKYSMKLHFDEIKKLNSIYMNDYKRIKDNIFFESDVGNEIEMILKRIECNINKKVMDLINCILLCQQTGTIIINEMSSMSIMNNMNENKYYSKLAFKSPTVDMINFYNNNVIIDKPLYNDILNTIYKPLLLNIKCYKLNEKYIFEIEFNNIKIIKYFNGTNMTQNPPNYNDYKYIGAFDLGYIVMNKKKWDEIGDGCLTAGDKRNIIYDFCGNKFFTESIDSNDSLARNGGSYLMFIKINKDNIKFFEENFGIRNNKRLSSIDFMISPIKKILKKLKDLLVKNISYYTQTDMYFKSVPSDKYVDGITDWMPYIVYIEKILNEEKVDNIHISVYRDMYPISPKPDPKPDPKPIISFTVDDSTHNIKFTIMNTIKNISMILFYIGSNKIPEEHKYNDIIVLKKMIHKKTNIMISFIGNDMKIKYSDKIVVKLTPCTRMEFTEETKKQSLLKYNYRCGVTCIKLNEINRYQFDHIDNMNCNNNIENCMPLLTEIHDIKSYNNIYYNKLVNNIEELKKYKLGKIESIKESLN